MTIGDVVIYVDARGDCPAWVVEVADVGLTLAVMYPWPDRPPIARLAGVQQGEGPGAWHERRDYGNA